MPIRIHAMPSFAGLAIALAAAAAMAQPAVAPQAPPAPMGAAAAAAPAPANPADPTGAVAAGAAGKTAPEGLYDALGGKPGIARIMNGLVDRAFKDARIGHLFKETKPQALKDSLTNQICLLAGGPCRYEGADMKAAHADMEIRKRDFNVLVELLQDSMTEQGVAFTQQSRLLALLAPMHRDVITVR